MKPFLSGRAIVPVRLMRPQDITKAKRELVFTSVDYSHTHSLPDDEEPDPEETTVNEYRQVHDGRTVTLPRDWAMKNLINIKFKDKTTFPSAGRKKTHKIEPRNDEQRAFFDTLKSDAMRNGPIGILANANTGSGKSVATVWLGIELNTPTLIFVDSNKLKNQYLRLFDTLMGKAWRRKHVGITQQDRCQFEDKHFVIAMVQSVSHRKYPSGFYRHFGLIIYDEVQIFGSKTFSRCLGCFTARVTVGLTATNKGGEFGKLIKAHIGKPRIKSKQEVMHPLVYDIKIAHDKVWPSDSEGLILNMLGSNQRRNEAIAQIADNAGYQRGRQVLILSHRIFQLQRLEQMLINRGIPKDKIGLHVGKYETGKIEVCAQYDQGSRRKIYVEDDRNAAKRTYNRLLRLNSKDDYITEFGENHALIKQLGKKRISWHLRKEQYAPTENDLDNITNFCQIILATYQIFLKGVDVPRLDMGIEALPIGNATQPLGRIVRVLDGKLQPEWYSFWDRIIVNEPSANQIYGINTLNGFFDGKHNSRVKAFKAAKAKIMVKTWQS